MPPPQSADLKKLLPAQVETILSTQAPAKEPFMPDVERAAMVSMHPKRRSEFMHGRICAREALAALGLPEQTIPVGANREPVWPADVIGSISHCGSVAAAVTARGEYLGGLGIDLELAEPLDSEVLRLICLPFEQTWLEQTDDPLQFAKLIFSAKESIFKCIWPTLRHFVDFQDIGICIDINAGTFAPVQWANNLPATVIRSITGRYLLQDGWILTTACMPSLET
jgi:4'-phosphopantetheinyl transferase EntD